MFRIEIRDDENGFIYGETRLLNKITREIDDAMRRN